jgi:hypothetical protein
MPNHKLLLTLVLPLLLLGCQQPKTNHPNPTPTPQEATPTPTPTQAQIDYYQDALSKGAGAANITQTAYSQADWALVVNMWQEAINLLKSISRDSPNYSLARKKIVEYQNNLRQANKMVSKLASNTTATDTTESSPTNVAFEPTTSTPVVTATVTPQPRQLSDQDEETETKTSIQKFMEEYFSDIVNKGYSGTTSWCASEEDLASSFFTPVSWKILDISAYSGSNEATVTATIESSNKGGIPIRNNWDFYIKKGDTVLEKELIKTGKKSDYQYSKSTSGGWCIQLISEK